MFGKLKYIIPLPLRVEMKKAFYSLQDVVSPVAALRVPSRRDSFIGGGDFTAMGDAFFDILKHYGLEPGMDVLDVGCGQGRMARPMAGWLEGNYRGIDIAKDGIGWCQSRYKDVPNFTFLHGNVHNARYNPGGDIMAKDYRFPFTEGQFDRVFLTSVFTHMFKDDVENYLAEIARVMKPGGKCLISWYLWDGPPKQAKMQFRFPVDSVSRTTLKSNPEAAMAFDLDWVKALYAKYGLSIADIQRGEWAGGAGMMGLQDLITAVK